MYFPQFNKDIDVLFNEGVIKRIAFDHYEWTKSETSLAEYFKWISPEKNYIPGGFWGPVEKVFRIDRRKLSKLAGENGNILKPKKSKDFQDVKKIVEEYREQEQQEQKDKEKFNAIKILIDEAEGEGIKSIRVVLEKIKTILT
jgi:hypothetical protein